MSFYLTDTAVVSEEDFRKITDELGPDELQHLFHNLGITQRDIEHAERSANTTDTRLKARAVLGWWKKTTGRAATRETLFEAKRNISNGTNLIIQGRLFFFLVIYSNTFEKLCTFCNYKLYQNDWYWDMVEFSDFFFQYVMNQFRS